MRNNRSVIFIILSGAVLFNILFWQEQLALNALLFEVFILSTLFWLYPGSFKNRIVQGLLPVHFTCLATVLIYDTPVSQVALLITLLLIAAFAEYEHRSAWFAGNSLLLNFVFFIASFSNQVRTTQTGKRKRPLLGKIIRFSIIPVLIALAFFIIYSLANSAFSDIMSRIGLQLQLFFTHLFEIISVERLLFLLAGFYFTGALLMRARSRKLEQAEAGKTDDLRRERKHRLSYDGTLIGWILGRLSKGVLALKNEYTTGLISLVLLNALLLIVNCVDINYLWLHFSYTPDVNLTAMIHEGTELLILSLVLAMIVLLFFFRGNLNFYTRNKWLKAGAYLWLLQNTLLVVSVLIRDYYYIKLSGLAYKRIGVLFFLLLVLFGLVTICLKIIYKKTTYYLLRVNAWAVILLLVAASAVDWDMTIARYNIQHNDRAPLDLSFLLSLSPRTLPLLEQNLPLLKQREKELNQKGEQIGDCSDCVVQILKDRQTDYLKEQAGFTWLSWNYTDEQVKQQLADLKK
jgi:hypothetical protein